jgi:hypothetical protein
VPCLPELLKEASMWTKVKHEYDPVTGSRSYLDGWVDEEAIARANEPRTRCHREPPKAMRRWVLVGTTEDGQRQYRAYNRYTWRLDEAFTYMHQAAAVRSADRDIADCDWLARVEVYVADVVPMECCVLLRVVHTVE